MKFPVKTFCVVAAVGGLMTVLGGCAADVSGGGPVVYGDVGYVQPWYYPGAWFGGGDHYVHPPYDHGGDFHGGGGRPAPSIPSAPRPAPSGGGGGDRRR